MPEQDQYQFNSSNIDTGTYDPDTRTMTITFNKGATYTWDRVDPVMWDRLKSAPSAGRFLRENFGMGTPA